MARNRTLFSAYILAAMLGVFSTPGFSQSAAVPSVLDAETAIRQRDYSRAFTLLSEQGLSADPEALFLLANLYRSGRGVGRDYKAAFELTKQAAELGHTEAQFSTGNMLLSGRGVEMDRDAARGWIIRAAENGHAKAVMLLVTLMQPQIRPPDPAPDNTIANTQHFKGSDIQAQQGRNALIEAANRGEIRVMKALITQGENLAERDNLGRTALSYAAASGHLEIVRILLNAGADPDITDLTGTAAVGYASMVGNLPILEQLLAAGAIANMKDNKGRTPFLNSVLSGQCDAAAMLLTSGGLADNISNPQRLPIAVARHCSVQLFDDLALQNQPLDGVDEHDRNAIWHAAQAGRSKNVTYLINAGMAFGLADQNGVTPLIAALNSRHPDVAAVLLASGANPNQISANGNSALSIVSRFGDVSTLNQLLQSGADIDHRNAAGYTALMLAAQSGQREVFAELLTRGANTGLRNKKRERVREIAVAAGFPELVELLDQ